MFLFCLLMFSVNRFSILALEWTLCRFIPSARLTPTSVLAEQDVQDQGSVTGNSRCFLFAIGISVELELMHGQ